MRKGAAEFNDFTSPNEQSMSGLYRSLWPISSDWSVQKIKLTLDIKQKYSYSCVSLLLQVVTTWPALTVPWRSSRTSRRSRRPRFWAPRPGTRCTSGTAGERRSTPPPLWTTFRYLAWPEPTLNIQAVSPIYTDLNLNFLCIRNVHEWCCVVTSLTQHHVDQMICVLVDSTPWWSNCMQRFYFGVPAWQMETACVPKAFWMCVWDHFLLEHPAVSKVKPSGQNCPPERQTG